MISVENHKDIPAVKETTGYVCRGVVYRLMLSSISRGRPRQDFTGLSYTRTLESVPSPEPYVLSLR